MRKDNVIQFPLEKEDYMRLKPEDICGRIWKSSKYGSGDNASPLKSKLKVLK